MKTWECIVALHIAARAMMYLWGLSSEKGATVVEVEFAKVPLT